VDEDVDEADIPSFTSPSLSQTQQPKTSGANSKGKQPQPYVPEQLAPPHSGTTTPQVTGQIGSSSGSAGGRASGTRSTVAGVRVEMRYVRLPSRYLSFIDHCPFLYLCF
jgi:hypothetical protein